MKKQNFVGVKYDVITSFIFSIFIYFALIFLLFFQVSKMRDLAVKYTDDKNAYMDIIVDWEIDDSVPKAPNISDENSQAQQKEEIKKEESKKTEIKEIEKIVEKKIEEPKPAEKAEKPIEKVEKKELNLNDLFNETTKDNKKLIENANLKNENKKESVKNAVQQADKKSGKSQMTGQYDEFRGGVQKKLQILWSRYSANSNDDALVDITFGANGKVIDYKILELSYNSEFNQKLRDFMDNLSMQDFPKPPGGKSYTIHKINLKDKI